MLFGNEIAILLVGKDDVGKLGVSSENKKRLVVQQRDFHLLVGLLVVFEEVKVAVLPRGHNPVFRRSILGPGVSWREVVLA